VRSADQNLARVSAGAEYLGIAIGLAAIQVAQRPQWKRTAHLLVRDAPECDRGIPVARVARSHRGQARTNGAPNRNVDDAALKVTEKREGLARTEHRIDA